MELTTFRTADADPLRLEAVRSLLDRAFDGDFSDDDWAHSLGGWHVTALDADVVVSHASVVRRRLHIDGVTFDTGYVEAVATEPDRQGSGFGTAVMRAVADLIGSHHELGALSTGEHHFYERLGWRRWRGPTYVLDGVRLIRTEDEDDGIMVLLPAAGDVDLTAPIACERRSGDDW